jgi:uncharacterized membrane protein YdjX (TVP38/TMEM64 family)
VKRHRKQIVFLVLLAAMAALFVWLQQTDWLTFENLKAQREFLKNLVDAHYVPAALGFVILFFSSAFFFPGALVLTLAGGFLFGTVPGALYVNIGATTGATTAFLLARHLIGRWIQRKYERQLTAFNEEIARHGSSYLIVMRILPLFPFFVVNYLAGLTEISLKRFIWTTSLGMFPGSFIYAFAGRQLATIESPEEILSPQMVLLFVLLVVLALSPVIVHHLERIRHR